MILDEYFFASIIFKRINYKETHTKTHQKIDKTTIQSVTNTVKTYKRGPNCVAQ